MFYIFLDRFGRLVVRVCVEYPAERSDFCFRFVPGVFGDEDFVSVEERFDVWVLDYRGEGNGGIEAMNDKGGVVAVEVFGNGGGEDWCGFRVFFEVCVKQLVMVFLGFVEEVLFGGKGDGFGCCVGVNFDVVGKFVTEC